MAQLNSDLVSLQALLELLYPLGNRGHSGMVFSFTQERQALLVHPQSFV